MLQTGLFGREENARTMAERLRKAGFTPVIVRKTVNGGEHWAVGVAPGADPSRTILLLKDRGFESFPVYRE
jgi:cell division septation protein DedD